MTCTGLRNVTAASVTQYRYFSSDLVFDQAGNKSRLQPKLPEPAGLQVSDGFQLFSWMPISVSGYLIQ